MLWRMAVLARMAAAGSLGEEDTALDPQRTHWLGALQTQVSRCFSHQ